MPLPIPGQLVTTGLAMLLVSVAQSTHAEDSTGHPIPKKTRQMMTSAWEKQVDELTEQIKQQPDRVGFYSRRADAHFYLAQFDKSVADYQKMVALDPKLDKAHWRRGIAWFYAKNYKQAAHQFEIYDNFDNVDRENGIWRFFSQAQAYGLKKARKGLLQYKKDDREPFPSVYKLFSETTTPETIVANITAAKISDTEREKRFFYAHLYIGLDHAVHKRNKPAVKHLRQAVANTWGPKSGFGPHYMWQVGRLHYELLTAKNK